MTKPLNELHTYPKWIDTMTKEQQYEWYLQAKKSIPTFEKFGDVARLKQAIAEYEIKHNIV